MTPFEQWADREGLSEPERKALIRDAKGRGALLDWESEDELDRHLRAFRRTNRKHNQERSNEQ